MTIEQSFTIDILGIVPDNSTCYIQCPSIDDDSKIRELFMQSEFSFYYKIFLTPENKQKLKSVILNESIVDYFQNMTIKCNDITLMEAFDGNVIGIFSKKINVPQLFLDKYSQTGHAEISDDW
ncbi:MAG: hypothetical protein IPI31_04855 [Bacteroidetes bacterium]|jgi:hypothetical protein|nr:hypothetical protein [Bacteroidota bacterium]